MLQLPGLKNIETENKAARTRSSKGSFCLVMSLLVPTLKYVRLTTFDRLNWSPGLSSHLVALAARLVVNSLETV